MISDVLWKRLGGDRGILGKPITLNGHPYSVIGVMPPWFRLPIAGPYGNAHTNVWLPLDPKGRGQARDRGEFFSYARRKPGVSFAQAEADVKQVAAVIAQRDPVRPQRLPKFYFEVYAQLTFTPNVRDRSSNFSEGGYMQCGLFVAVLTEFRDKLYTRFSSFGGRPCARVLRLLLRCWRLRFPRLGHLSPGR